MALDQTPIPSDELARFAALEDIHVVVDVGARTDTDYIRLKPGIELHAFEPNKEFFAELKRNIGERPHTFLNNFGLSDTPGIAWYNNGRQAFSGGEAGTLEADAVYPVRTLDEYVRGHGLSQIDFLKIDAEGYDYKVLVGGKETIPTCRYIQYEHWNDKDIFHRLLGKMFRMEYIGHRNVFCTRI